tara:strand:- start:61 stop:267 length:207 start_codon:yes stop_codon:yes gene_type:complete
LRVVALQPLPQCFLGVVRALCEVRVRVRWRGTGRGRGRLKGRVRVNLLQRIARLVVAHCRFGRRLALA